jgi:hypothetical protein
VLSNNNRGPRFLGWAEGPFTLHLWRTRGTTIAGAAGPSACRGAHSTPVRGSRRSCTGVIGEAGVSASTGALETREALAQALGVAEEHRALATVELPAILRPDHGAASSEPPRER